MSMQLPENAPTAIYVDANGRPWRPEDLPSDDRPLPDAMPYPVTIYHPSAIVPTAAHEFQKEQDA